MSTQKETKTQTTTVNDFVTIHTGDCVNVMKNMKVSHRFNSYFAALLGTT